MKNEKGVLLLAVGNTSYAGWAVNLAVTLHFYSPGLTIDIIMDEGTERTLSAEERRLFARIHRIKHEHYHESNGKIAPGKAKLNLYEYSRFGLTIYIDADSCVRKDITPLYELLKGNPVKGQVFSKAKAGDRDWECHWMPLGVAREKYMLDSDVEIPVINSSFLYFEKCAEAENFFNHAAANFIERFESKWGKSFPDELGFNIAAAETGIDLAIGEGSRNYPVAFDDNFNEETYILSLYAISAPGRRRMYASYQYIINESFRKIMNNRSRYDYRRMMRSKFIVRGSIGGVSVVRRVEYPMVNPASPLPYKDGTIGIGITTRNREKNFQKCMGNIYKFLPEGARVVVVDDASDTDYAHATFRFRRNVGVAAAKNKCLELLDDCDHIFLFDDDCWPVVEKWERPYIESGATHLSFTFDHVFPKIKNNNHQITADSVFNYYINPCGCMLYFRGEAIKAVGGFARKYGKYGNEHLDLSVRIYKSGLTRHPCMDIKGSLSLFHSMDYFRETMSSVPRVDVKKVYGMGEDTSFHDYKISGDPFTVFCSYYNYAADPQRGEKWDADVSKVMELAKSVIDCGGECVVFHDCFENVPKIDGLTFHKVNPDKEYCTNVYRWMAYDDYLKGHPVDGNLFFVDSTDVIVLKAPVCEENIMYVGDEKGVCVDNNWMKKEQTPYVVIPDYVDIIDRVKARPLLNVGIIGGRNRIAREYMSILARYDRQYSRGIHTSTDMATGNYVLYKYYDGKISHGPHVNTLFKGYELNNIAWFQHK